MMCPDCSVPLEPWLQGAMTHICSGCRHLLVRTNAGVALGNGLQSPAQLNRPDSPLRVGMTTHFEDYTLTLQGRLMKRNRAGNIWDEWAVQIVHTGKWGWLSHGENGLWLLWEQALALSPQERAVGPEGKLLQDGVFYTFAERGVAFVDGAEGQLPVGPDAFDDRSYVDLKGPDNLVASVDPDSGTTGYFGTNLSAQALGLQDALAMQTPSRAIHAQRQCPKCQTGFALRDFTQSVHASCPNCWVMLNVVGAKASYAGQAPQTHDVGDLPMGASGLLHDVAYTVIGRIRRRALAFDKPEFAWDEYCVQTMSGERHWLTQAEGHWTLFVPIEQDTARAFLHGGTFRLYDSGVVRVAQAQGEFDWAVRLDAQSFTQDRVRPTQMLSREATNDEVMWTLGTYTPHALVAEAFGVRLRHRPRGVAPHQPWLLGGLLKWPLIFLAVTMLLWSITHIGRTPILSEDIELAALSTADEIQSHFFDAVPLRGHRNIRLRLKAPYLVENGWVDTVGEFHQKETGHTLPVDVSLFVAGGDDDDGHWQEDNSNFSAYYPAQPPGDYTLTLHANWLKWDKPLQMHVDLLQGYPSPFLSVLVASFHGMILFIYMLRRFSFESERLQNISIVKGDGSWASDP